MKLEIKHLAPYLPYGLKVYHSAFMFRSNWNENEIGVMVGATDNIQNETFDIVMIRERDKYKLQDSRNHFKPILRPLSDLTKEIEHNGEKFVPILELARLSNFCIYDNHKIVEKHSFGSADSEASYMFSYNKESISFEIENWNSFEGSSFEFVSNNFELVQKLLEWYFDVFSLIEQNLAIDINTLKR